MLHALGHMRRIDSVFDVFNDDNKFVSTESDNFIVWPDCLL
jgi:hypothetical protein